MHYIINSMTKSLVKRLNVFFYSVNARKSLLYVTALILISFSSISSAWNAVGHMVVAQIAYQNASPQVQKKIDGLVNYFKKEYPQMTSFLDLAYWPDAIRSQSNQESNKNRLPAMRK